MLTLQQRKFKDIQSNYISYIKAEYLRNVRQMKALDDGEVTDDEVGCPDNSLPSSLTSF
jgi:hypothetical protein